MDSALESVLNKKIIQKCRTVADALGQRRDYLFNSFPDFKYFGRISIIHQTFAKGDERIQVNDFKKIAVFEARQIIVNYRDTPPSGEHILKIRDNLKTLYYDIIGYLPGTWEDELNALYEGLNLQAF